MRVLVIGCGYVGLPLAERLAAEGHEVTGLRRSVPSSGNIRHIQGDITKRADLAAIEPAFDAVINTVSSTRGGPEEYRAVYLEGTRNLLQWLELRPPAKYLYTSSTSVYGQNDGSWVDERSAASPGSATSRILVETEIELLQAFRSRGFPAVILRVAGIYGPERGHLFKQFLRGEATLREDGSSYINNIHVHDVIDAIVHMLSAAVPGEIYNLTDNEPVTQLQFFRWLSAELNKALPPSAPATPERKRGLTNKRISNAKLRATGYQFHYPTFREGYATEIKRLNEPGRQSVSGEPES